MVLDPLSMRARGCGPSEGLLHTPSAGTQKKTGSGKLLLRKDVRMSVLHGWPPQWSDGTPPPNQIVKTSRACV